VGGKGSQRPPSEILCESGRVGCNFPGYFAPPEFTSPAHRTYLRIGLLQRNLRMSLVGCRTVHKIATPPKYALPDCHDSETGCILQQTANAAPCHGDQVRADGFLQLACLICKPSGQRLSASYRYTRFSAWHCLFRGLQIICI
jgi:hypothetical protein